MVHIKVHFPELKLLKDCFKRNENFKNLQNIYTMKCNSIYQDPRFSVWSKKIAEKSN